MQQTTYTIPVHIPDLQFFHSPQPFPLEKGGVLPELTIAYHTYGTLNAERNNVIWVCHALTANSNVADWWSGLFGPGTSSTRRYISSFVPISLALATAAQGLVVSIEETGRAFGLDFPLVTIRDSAGGT